MNQEKDQVACPHCQWKQIPKGKTCSRCGSYLNLRREPPVLVSYSAIALLLVLILLGGIVIAQTSWKIVLFTCFGAIGILLLIYRMARR